MPGDEKLRWWIVGLLVLAIAGLLGLAYENARARVEDLEKRTEYLEQAVTDLRAQDATSKAERTFLLHEHERLRTLVEGRP